MSDTVSARAPARLDLRFAAIVGLCFAVLLAPRISMHVPWRDEWHVWLVASTSPTFGELLARLRYDGHPSLWYATLWLVSRGWNDPLAMKVVHAILATSVAVVVAAAAPFPRWQRVMLTFGYFFGFEYAVISRNYAFGALFLMLAAAIAARRPRAYVAIAVALALAVQSNAFAGLIALALGGWSIARWWRDGRPTPARFAAGSAILLAGLLLAAWTTRAPPDLENTPWMFDVSVARAGKVAAAPWRSFVPLPSVGRHWWSTNVLDATLDVPWLMPTQAILGLAVIVLAGLSLPRGPRMLRWLWFGTVAGVLTFSYLKFSGSLRHHGHLFLLYVVLVWIGRADTGGRESAPTLARRGWIVLLSIHLLAGLIASAADVARPFSAARAVAQFVRGRYADPLLIGQRDLEASSVAGELGRRIFFPVPGRWGRFVIWNDRRSGHVYPGRLDDVAAQLAAEHPGRPVVLLLSDGSDERPHAETFVEVARFADSTEATEAFTIFEWRATQSFVGPATRPAGRQ